MLIPGLNDSDAEIDALTRWVAGQPGPDGLRYACTGNVHDPEGQSTRCHECSALLIERDWYRLGTWGLTGDGRCANCDTPLAGVFDGPSGTWGPRRLPARIVNQ